MTKPDTAQYFNPAAREWVLIDRTEPVVSRIVLVSPQPFSGVPVAGKSARKEQARAVR